MFDYIPTLLRRQGHKELMLIGLYLVFILIYAVASSIELYLHIYPMFFMKITLVLILIFLLFHCLSSRRTSFFAAALIIIIELECAISVLNDQYDSFMIAHPFVLIFGFFFFFRLRTALIATALHYLSWGSIIMYTQYLYPQDYTAYTFTSIVNIFISSFLILIFSLFYYFSTERSYEKLVQSNRQNKILLKEIHHRIKNNLNMIASILGLQIMSLKNNSVNDAGEVLLKNKLRIEAIAKVHEALYNSSDLENIDFSDYIDHLSHSINQSYGRKIPLHVVSNNIALPLDTMLNLGIIINELLANTIKHSLKNRRDAKDSIHIRLEKEHDTYILTYHEHNNHLADLIRLQNSKSLGMRLIRLLVKQMDAEMEIFQKDGLMYSIVFGMEHALPI